MSMVSSRFCGMESWSTQTYVLSSRPQQHGAHIIIEFQSTRELSTWDWDCTAAF